MLYRAALTVIVALIFGVLVVGGWARTPIAEAQPTQTFTVPDKVPEEWVKKYRTVVRSTESADPVKRSAARRILTRSIAKVGGSRFLAASTRLGLIGAAAGSWAVVGYELKYISELGDTQSVATGLRVAPASGARYGFGTNTDLKRGGAHFISRFHWKVTGDSASRTYEVGLTRNLVVENFVKTNYGSSCGWASYGGGVGATRKDLNGATSTVAGWNMVVNESTADCTTAAPEYVGSYESSSTGALGYTNYSYHLRTVDFLGKNQTAPVQKLGPELCESVGCSFTSYFPMVQTGPSTLPESQLSPDYTTTAAEGNEVISEVVTDPEIPTVVPDAPPDWDELPDPPADPVYDPEAPENDPDPDAPSWNPDPYGDPASPLYDPESPEADPDEDGQPNASDPDPYRPSQPTGGPDGDPDNDGVPNSSDPAPQDPDKPQKNQGDVCPVAPKPNFELPEIESASVFPFSLILRAWGIFTALIAPPEAPTFDVPGMGLIKPPPSFDPLAATIRAVIGLVCTVGMCFWFYRYISGKGSE